MIKILKIRDFIFNNKKGIAFLGLFVILCFWIYVSSIPKGFQKNVVVKIEDGETVKEIANELKENKLIKSKTLFYSLLIIQGKDDDIMAGEYLFHDPQSIFNIVERIVGGDYGIESKKVVLKEGFTLNQMANVLEDIFPNFDRTEFEIETSLFEGYYFPDTYVFPENADTKMITKKLRETFDEKIKVVEKVSPLTEKSLQEVVIMASIIEKESTAEGRQEVANILWHRMEIGMALQVDATFVYERGKGTFDLTKKDLLTDSPYNTYTKAGLPPTAISNPGLESLLAAANPQPTENIFFLTGSDGEMYYASTFEGHKENRRKYLN